MKRVAHLIVCSCLLTLGACEVDGDSGPADEGDTEGADEGEGGGETDIRASCADDASSVGEVVGPVTSMQAVGDSILGWHKEVDAAIPDVVGQELGVTMQNNAIGGAEFLGSEGIGSLYESSGNSHVLVNGGGNDFARDCSEQTLDALIASDLQTGKVVDLVDAIELDGAQPIIMGYYLPSDRETGCEHFPELMRRYRQLAQERQDGMYICTLETITPDTPDFYEDTVHPSQAGSAAVGKLIADALR